MINNLSDIWKGTATRNVSKLLLANVVAQAIGLAVYPLLTRLYAPEDFGLLNLFTALGGVFVILSTLDWHKAIVLPQRDEDARAVAQLALFAVAALTIFLLLTIPLSHPIAQLFNSPQLAAYYWMLPFYVCLVGVWNILNYCFIRRKTYGGIGGYAVAQSLFSVGYKTAFGYGGLLQGGLIYSTLLSPLCALLAIFIPIKNNLRTLFVGTTTPLRQVASTYSNFPKYSLPHTLINNIAYQLPVLLLTPFFGTRLVGFWSMAILLSFTPVNMITNALHQVFYQKTTEQVNLRQSIRHFYRNFTLYALAIIIPFFIALWFVLPSLTRWMLGDEWRITGEYIRWLLLWLVPKILCASTGYLFDVFGKQRIGLRFEIIIALARLIGLGIGIYYNNFLLAIAGYSVASALINALQYIWLMKLVKSYDQQLTTNN